MAQAEGMDQEAAMKAERIILGVGIEVENGRPWYRVEMRADDDGSLTLETTAGNGIEKPETVACLSLVLAATLIGIPAPELLDVVNAYRTAAGLERLEDVAFND